MVAAQPARIRALEENGVHAVLLSFHGSITNLDDMPAFLANIRRGRPAPPDLVREITARYRRIGGSPLLEQTTQQARALSERLGIPVVIAGRLWAPYPFDALRGLVAELGPGLERGPLRVLSLPLAPQSVHVYNDNVKESAERLSRELGETSAAKIELVGAPSWGDEPLLIDAFVETIDETLGRVPDVHRATTHLLLTAHSLPKRVIASGDPYEHDFREMAGRVVASLGGRALATTQVAFQSQGASNEPWLGPTLDEAMRSAVASGATCVVVAPIGFLAEHVETLYDLDIEAPDLARAAGVQLFLRTAAVQDRPRFIDALEAVARRSR